MPQRGVPPRRPRLLWPLACQRPRRKRRQSRRTRSRGRGASRTTRRAPSDLGASQNPRRQKQEPRPGEGRPGPACRALGARRLHPAAAAEARAAECVAPAEVRVRRGGCARADEQASECVLGERGGGGPRTHTCYKGLGAGGMVNPALQPGVSLREAGGMEGECEPCLQTGPGRHLGGWCPLRRLRRGKSPGKLGRETGRTHGKAGGGLERVAWPRNYGF